MKNIIENIQKNIAKENAKISLITELDELVERKQKSLDWSKDYLEKNPENDYARESYNCELKEFEVFKETLDIAINLISNI